jgi:hypothetical protein
MELATFRFADNDFKNLDFKLESRMNNYVMSTMHTITLDEIADKAKSVTFGMDMRQQYGEKVFNQWCIDFYEKNKEFIG